MDKFNYSQKRIGQKLNERKYNLLLSDIIDMNKLRKSINNPAASSEIETNTITREQNEQTNPRIKDNTASFSKSSANDDYIANLFEITNLKQPVNNAKPIENQHVNDCRTQLRAENKTTEIAKERSVHLSILSRITSVNAYPDIMSARPKQKLD